MPSAAQIKQIITANLRPLKANRWTWKTVIEAAANLSQSEIARAADDAVKTAILDERKDVSAEDILSHLRDRRNMRVAFMDSDVS